MQLVLVGINLCLSKYLHFVRKLNSLFDIPIKQFFIGPVFTKIPKITHLEKLFHIGLATTFFNRLHCGRILNISYYTPRKENAHKSSSFQVLWCVDESFSQSDSHSGSSFMHICKFNTIFSSLIYRILIYFDI